MTTLPEFVGIFKEEVHLDYTTLKYDTYVEMKNHPRDGDAVPPVIARGILKREEENFTRLIPIHR